MLRNHRAASRQIQRLSQCLHRDDLDPGPVGLLGSLPAIRDHRPRESEPGSFLNAPVDTLDHP